MEAKNTLNRKMNADAAQIVFPSLNISGLPVPMMVFRDHEPYQLVYMNECMLYELGYHSQQELESHVGGSLLSYIHPDDCDAFRKYASSLQGQTQEQKYRCRIRKKDYRYLWYELVWCVPCGAADIPGRVCICNNMTELFDLKTAHTNSECMLRNAQGELESMIENLPGGWHICRLFDGISLHYASDGLCQICGYTRQEIKERFHNQYVMLIHEDDRHIFLNAVQELTAYPHTTELEYRIVHKNGSVIWVSDRLKSSRNREGVMFAYAVVTEIGKWHTAWQKMQSLVDTAPCGIVMFEYRKSDGKVSIQFCNDTACAISGYPQAELEQLDVETLCSAVAPEDYSEVERQFKQMIETGVGMDCVFQVIGKACFWAHMTARVIEQDHDTCLVNAAFQDFTEKKHLEKQLSYHHYCLEKINQSLSSGIIIKQLGLENSPQYVSRNISNILGYSMPESERSFSSCYQDIIYPDDYQRIVDAIAQHKKQRTPHFELEFRVIKKDGSILWVKEAADRLDDFAVEHAYLIIFTDITDLKHAEMQLRMREEEYRIAVSKSKNIIVRYNIAEKSVYIPKEVPVDFDLPETIENMPYQFLSKGLISPTSIANYSQLFACADRGENFETEIQAVGSSGKEYCFHASSSVVFDDRQNPASAVILFSDITEHKQTEKAMHGLKESEQLFQIIVESSSKLLLRYHFSSDSFDPYGPAANKLCAGLSRPYTAEKIISTNFFDQESQNDLYAFYMQIKKGTPKGTVLLKAKNHATKWVWYTCSFITVFDSYHLPQYSVVFCEDITAQHENELVSQRFNDFMKPGSRGIEVNLEYNLTTDSFERIDGELPVYFRAILTTGSYTTAIVQIAQHLADAQQNSFIANMSRDNLLDAFENGSNSGTCEILVSNEAEPIWVQIYYQMLKEPYTSQISIWLSIRNIDHQKKSELQLVEMAQMDEVTGIYNRAGLKIKVDEKRHVVDSGTMNLFIMLDIDGFGRVNDTFGHVYGDQLLRELAQTLKLLLNETNIVARIGGDEFAIYAFGLTDMSMVQERMRILIAAAYRELRAGLKLSISAGVAISPQDGTDLHVLYEKADTALYYAKMTGRNKYVLYSDNLAPVEAGLPSITPIDENVQVNSGVYVRTFGYFDIFVNGEALLIPNAKAKELLALLVDRRGGYVTPSEIIGCLWENEPANKITLARCRKVAMLLRNALREYGLEDLMESQKGARRLNRNLVNCDLYNFLSGKPEYAHLFKGSYMLNYSWGECAIAELENFKMFRQNSHQPVKDADKPEPPSK